MRLAEQGGERGLDQIVPLRDFGPNLLVCLVGEEGDEIGGGLACGIQPHSRGQPIPSVAQNELIAIGDVENLVRGGRITRGPCHRLCEQAGVDQLQ